MKPPVPSHSLTRLRELTPARVGLGRVGASVPTKALLDFTLAHARARDAVHAIFDGASLTSGLRDLDLKPLEVSSQARHRRDYLRRPDLGRMLDAEFEASIGEPQPFALRSRHRDRRRPVACGGKRACARTRSASENPTRRQPHRDRCRRGRFRSAGRAWRRDRSHPRHAHARDVDRRAARTFRSRQSGRLPDLCALYRSDRRGTKLCLQYSQHRIELPGGRLQDRVVDPRGAAPENHGCCPERRKRLLVCDALSRV